MIATNYLFRWAIKEAALYLRSRFVDTIKQCIVHTFNETDNYKELCGRMCSTVQETLVQSQRRTIEAPACSKLTYYKNKIINFNCQPTHKRSCVRKESVIAEIGFDGVKEVAILAVQKAGLRRKAISFFTYLRSFHLQI